jgi:hypothetical protein
VGGSKSDSKAFGRLLCSRPKAKTYEKKSMKFIFCISVAKSVSLASMVHGTIHGSNTGPAKPTFVNFQALQFVTDYVEVPKRTLDALNFISKFLFVEHP